MLHSVVRGVVLFIIAVSLTWHNHSAGGNPGYHIISTGHAPLTGFDTANYRSKESNHIRHRQLWIERTPADQFASYARSWHTDAVERQDR
jgi:hypothetical protein